MRRRANPETAQALLPRTLTKRTGAVSAHTNAVRAADGDGYSPLNDNSRLAKREDYIRYFGDQRDLVLMRQLVWTAVRLDSDRTLSIKDIRKSKLVRGDAAYDKFVGEYGFAEENVEEAEKTELDATAVMQAAKLYDAYTVVKYKQLSNFGRMIRMLWIVFSFGGTIPKAWDMLSTSSFTVAITIVTSYLIQSQTEAQNLLNGRESYIQAESFVHNAFQMGVLVLGMLSAVQTINYLTQAWKSPRRIIYEERFQFLLDNSMRRNKSTPDYMLEYNTECDPDIAFMYFTLREELKNNGKASLFGRIGELLTLRVHEDLIWNKVVIPALLKTQ